MRPRYKKVWAEILFAHVMLVIGAAGLALTEERFDRQISWIILALPLGAFWIGGWIHYLLCFFHEATHYLILPHRKYNDLAANLFLGALVGLEVKSYRKTHWLHHSHLGTTKDTETSYFEPLKPRTLIYDLLGRYHLRVLLRYFKKPQRNLSQPSNSKTALVVTVLIHLSIALLLYLNQYPLTAVTWLLGFFSIYPLFNRLRQTLEHRAADAQEGADYNLVDHGPVNRMYGSDLFSKIFGAAGFNRHLLHHWDPAISYTRFDEMEKFMLETEYASLIEENRTTYWKLFREMLK